MTTEEEAEQLVWFCKANELASASGLERASWAGVIQREVIEHARNRSLSVPTEAGVPYHQAAVVMMLKDEGDIIELNIEWLYFVGFRKFVLMNNSSSDTTGESIKKFIAAHSDVEVYTIEDPIIAYVQASKTTALFRFALSIWRDLQWIFPLDADEFLVPMSGLDQVGTVGGVDGIILPKVVHFLDEPIDAHIDDPRAKMPIRSELFWLPPKVAARADLSLTIQQGNHQLGSQGSKNLRYESGLAKGFYIREFPVRSFSHFCLKIRNGARAIRAAEKATARNLGGSHWIRYAMILEEGGESSLRTIFQLEWVKSNVAGYLFDPFAQ